VQTAFDAFAFAAAIGLGIVDEGHSCFGDELPCFLQRWHFAVIPVPCSFVPPRPRAPEDERNLDVAFLATERDAGFSIRHECLGEDCCHPIEGLVDSDFVLTVGAFRGGHARCQARLEDMLTTYLRHDEEVTI
jgi:hypothetical protein